MNLDELVQFAVGRLETRPPLRCGSEGSVLLGATVTCVFGEVGVADLCEDADATGADQKPADDQDDTRQELLAQDCDDPETTRITARIRRMNAM